VDDPAGPESTLFELRPRLVRFFCSRGRSWAADELADDVILRVLEKRRTGYAIENLQAFTIGVARIVWLEHLRSGADKTDPLPEDFEGRHEEAESSADLDCLEQSLRQIPAAARALVLRFYGAGAEESKNKSNRRRLAEEFGLSMNALFLRVSKLRRQLERSVADCLDGRDRPAQESARGRTTGE
jgi:DNA-directed RNA polymerase specialized sigma24 family protein